MFPAHAPCACMMLKHPVRGCCACNPCACTQRMYHAQAPCARFMHMHFAQASCTCCLHMLPYACLTYMITRMYPAHASCASTLSCTAQMRDEHSPCACFLHMQHVHASCACITRTHRAHAPSECTLRMHLRYITCNQHTHAAGACAQVATATHVIDAAQPTPPQTSPHLCMWLFGQDAIYQLESLGGCDCGSSPGAGNNRRRSGSCCWCCSPCCCCGLCCCCCCMC